MDVGAFRQPSEPPGPLPTYNPPTWGAPSPLTDPLPDYSLEFIKHGAIVSTLPIVSQSFYTLGRHPACDVITEHPSCSR